MYPFSTSWKHQKTLTFMVPFIKDDKALPYPDIWKQVLETKKELK